LLLVDNLPRTALTVAFVVITPLPKPFGFATAPRILRFLSTHARLLYVMTLGWRAGREVALQVGAAVDGSGRHEARSHRVMMPQQLGGVFKGIILGDHQHSRAVARPPPRALTGEEGHLVVGRVGKARQRTVQQHFGRTAAIKVAAHKRVRHARPATPYKLLHVPAPSSKGWGFR
jgi:hypothetical protein